MHRPTTPCTFMINPRTPFTCDGRVGGNAHLRPAHPSDLRALVDHVLGAHVVAIPSWTVGPTT